MWYWIIAILLIGSAAYYIPNLNNRRRSNIFLCCFTSFGLIIGVRNISIGIDTIGYYTIFNSIAANSNVFDAAQQNFVEYGYAVLNKAVSLCGGDYYWFQILYSVVMMVLLANFIQKTTKNVFMATIVFLGFGYFAFSYNIMRQMMGISIAANSWLLWKEKKIIYSLILLALSILVHKICSLYIIAFILYSFRNYRIIYWGFPILVCFSGILLPKLISFSLEYNLYANYTNIDRHGAEGGMIWIVWIIEWIIASTIIVSNEFTPTEKCIANLGFFCTVFASLDMYIRYLDRVGLTFYPFVLLTFCILGSKFKPNYRFLYSAGINLFFLSFYILRSYTEEYTVFF